MCCLLSSSSRCTTAKNKLTTLPGRVRKHFASIRLQRQMDVEQSYQDLCLDGLEVCLPSQEEQALKRHKALKNLAVYVQACGGALPEDWECTLRCRITSRRNRRQGVTTDNYYYSPCGKTFRTHKQVAEFLGLQPLSREQIKQQCSAQDTADVPAESYSIVSVTVLESASMAAVSTQSGKRSHSSMTATDTAAVCAESDQQQRPAASAPAAVGGTSSQTCSHLHAPAASSQPDSSVLSAPAASQQVAVERTKAALAAKYFASCSNLSSLAASTATVSAAATAGFSGLPSYTSAATQAMSVQVSCGSADASAQPRPACTAAAAEAQEDADPFLQFAPAQPAVSTNASSKGRSGSSSKAVSSRLVVVPAAVQVQPHQQLQQRTVQQQKQQQQPRVVQPVPKPWKPRAQPAWKLQLRALATQGAIADGLLPGPARPCQALPGTASTHP